MSARASILEKIRSQCRSHSDHRVEQFRKQQADSVNFSAGLRPQLASNLVDRFQAKSRALSTTLDCVARRQEIPAVVARYLAQSGLLPRLVCWPSFTCLDWAAAGIVAEARPANGDDAVGLTGAYAGVAETGTLVLCSGAATSAATSLLPETHIAVIHEDRIMNDMECVWAAMRQEFGSLPRAVNFISGPSRTGDIEQTIVLGAHGPYRVHVILVAEASLG
jgi:L-lactate dehydrogenase complex protein LldG